MTEDLSSKKVTIPDWWDCNTKQEKLQPLTALERFVLDQEPAGTEDEAAFRDGLAAVLEEALSAERPADETTGDSNG